MSWACVKGYPLPRGVVCGADCKEGDCVARRLGATATAAQIAEFDALEWERAQKRRSASHGEAGYARRPHDAYFTEPWVTRLLLDTVDFASGHPRRDTLLWEPACGDGRMAREIEAAGYRVIASDIADWGWGACLDFLDLGAAGWLQAHSGGRTLAAIVTNPPFDQAVLFAGRALQLTRDVKGKVALLQRHEWDAAKERHALFDRHPFRCKIVLPRRPRWSDDDKASPRFPYAWFLWDWACPAPQATLYPGERAASEALL